MTRREVLTFEDVVRHRCNNGLCINPDHLEIGTRADNKRDDWEFAAYGGDFDMLYGVCSSTTFPRRALRRTSAM